MSLDKFKNDISQEEFRGQRLTDQDIEQFGRGTELAEFFSNDPDFIFVTKVYTGGNSLVDVMTSKSPPPVDPRTNQFILDPIADVRRLGYQQGTFRVEYNFWRFLVGNDDRPGVVVQQISPSRTEIAILPIKTGDTGLDAQNQLRFDKFSNLVLTTDEASAMLTDIFDEITADGIYDVMLNTLSDSFKERVYHISKYNTNEDTDSSLKMIIQIAIDASKSKILEEITNRGFVSFLKFLELYDTVLRQEIYKQVTIEENKYNFIPFEISR